MSFLDTLPRKGGDNGKGSAPRNNLSDTFRNNFGSIDWTKKSLPKPKKKK